MAMSETFHLRCLLVGSALALAGLFGACSSDEATPEASANSDTNAGSDTSTPSDGESPGPDVTADPDTATPDPDATPADPDGATPDPDGGPIEADGAIIEPDGAEPADGQTEDPVDPIGNATGEAVTLDHEAAWGVVEGNLKKHIDGLEDALKFLEDSTSVNNLVDMLFDDDDDDDEGEPAEGDGEQEEEDEPLEIDLADLRDDLVELIGDNLMVASTAVVADDGLSVTYNLDAEILCDEEPEENESEEAMANRMDDEEACEERVKNNPVSIVATSDGDDRIDMSLLAGADAVEVLAIQVHDDMMSVTGFLPNLQALLEAFVDPEDFELPETMEGSFACEIREDAPLVYTVRCSVLEAINATPADDQEPLSLQLNPMDEPVKLTIDGAAKAISGALTSEAVSASVPWQWIVDMFWDDEGYSEWTCEPNPDGEGESCWDEWIDPPEPPEVDEAFIVAIPGVGGMLGYDASDDIFQLMEVHVGGETTTVKVDDATIIS